MFKIIIYNFQLQNLSYTWQKSLKNKAVAKNSYLINGDMKKTKDFMQILSQYNVKKRTTTIPEELIFSRDMLAKSYAL